MFVPPVGLLHGKQCAKRQAIEETGSVLGGMPAVSTVSADLAQDFSGRLVAAVYDHTCPN
jgi:hypothetical protein